MTTMLKTPPKTSVKGFTETQLFNAIDRIDKGFLDRALDALHLDEGQRYCFFAEIADCDVDQAITDARVRIETDSNDNQSFEFSNDLQTFKVPFSCFSALQIKELTTARDNRLPVDAVIFKKYGDGPKASIRV